MLAAKKAVLKSALYALLIIVIAGLAGCSNSPAEEVSGPGKPEANLEEKFENNHEQEKKPSEEEENSIPPEEAGEKMQENNRSNNESGNNGNKNKPSEEEYITPLPWLEMVEQFSFLQSPIPGAKISSRDTQLPGAPRTYRNGIHEGLDFYNGYCGVDIYFGAPVYAAAEGTVLRIDHDYQELTPAEREEMLRRTEELGYTPEEDLDKLRGRQVWIQHRDEIITRYAHLCEVNEELSPGAKIQAGDFIGTIGNSGTSDAVAGTKNGAHLHFEIWVEGYYLGQALPPEKVRALWQQVLFD
ncbi:MAG: M23 family metallopeptidase [Firmicutes bacterium]|nr:M23 family metallopeptidase [Bacillota bacterium]